jgi:hypothetical protein
MAYYGNYAKGNNYTKGSNYAKGNNYTKGSNYGKFTNPRYECKTNHDDNNKEYEHDKYVDYHSEHDTSCNVSSKKLNLPQNTQLSTTNINMKKT